MPRTPTAVSPAHRPFALDNTVVSTLHRARALSRVLELWSGRWFVPAQVRDEAVAWPTQGIHLSSILAELFNRHILELVTLEPRVEGPLFAKLNRPLGQGEAATIAIGYHRQYGAGLDDK